jgi:hypothetical protein
MTPLGSKSSVTPNENIIEEKCPHLNQIDILLTSYDNPEKSQEKLALFLQVFSGYIIDNKLHETHIYVPFVNGMNKGLVDVYLYYLQDNNYDLQWIRDSYYTLYNKTIESNFV